MTSLYDISTASHIPALQNAIDLMKKGADHFDNNPDALAEIMATRLAEDMAPFAFQVWSVRHHSLNATKGIIAGEFTTPEPLPETDYHGYQKVLEEALAELEQYTEEQVNAVQDSPVTFRMTGMELPFTAENFALTFSLPNLYFHLTTLYDILRMKGVKIGKQDFLSLRVGLPG